MVSVRYAPRDAPQIGKGRWTLPLSLLNNEKLLGKIAEQGIISQAEMTRDVKDGVHDIMHSKIPKPKSSQNRP